MIPIPPEIEKHRVSHPLYEQGNAFNGFFMLKDRELNLCISNGAGWDHVSVSRFDHKPPSWEQMCYVKDLLFSPEEWVVQYHPAKKDYIDYGINVLHLWRPQEKELPKPPEWMV